MLGSGHQVRVRLAGDQGRNWQDDEGNKCRRWSRRFFGITLRQTSDLHMLNEYVTVPIFSVQNRAKRFL